MKFPLVPRFCYDEIVKQLERERERGDQLTKVVIRMKVAGGSIVRPLAARAPRPIDEFERAIDENKHAHRPGVRSALLAYVEREQRKNTPPEHILHTLTTWSSVSADARDDDDDDESDDVLAIVG